MLSSPERRTIMIVGNGPIADGLADTIDAADLVIRFNDCRSFGRGGQKTDVVAVCNTGRPARDMLGSDRWGEHPSVRAAGAIWGVRDPVTFANLRAPLACMHPDLDDFCDDLTGQFATFAHRTGKAFRTLDGDVHASVDAALAVFAPAPYIVPSSGMIVISAILTEHPGADIAFSGFSHQGWDGHPFDSERQLVDGYETDGLLRRLYAPVELAARSPYTSCRS